MKYCVVNAKRVLTFKPSIKWNGDHNFEFVISGKSDSDYAKCPATSKSIIGYITLLCDVFVTVKSEMQRIVALSTSEDGLF